MPNMFKIPKGTEVHPFTYLNNPAQMQNHGWEIVNTYDGEQVFAVGDYYFADKDILEYDYGVYFHIKLKGLFPLGNAFFNAFTVHQGNIENVII